MEMPSRPNISQYHVGKSTAQVHISQSVFITVTEATHDLNGITSLPNPTKINQVVQKISIDHVYLKPAMSLGIPLPFQYNSTNTAYSYVYHVENGQWAL
jgi:hypothetical protein